MPGLVSSERLLMRTNTANKIQKLAPTGLCRVCRVCKCVASPTGRLLNQLSMMGRARCTSGGVPSFFVLESIFLVVQENI